MNKNDLLNAVKMATKENPVTSKELEVGYGVSGCHIRDLVRELRRDGVPVCTVISSKKTGGYFYSANPADIKEMREDLIGRFRSLMQTVQMFDENFKSIKQDSGSVQSEFSFINNIRS